MQTYMQKPAWGATPPPDGDPVRASWTPSWFDATRSRTAAEACFQESSGMAIEQPQRLQHDHALVEARWRFGVIARCQGRAAKLQSVIADSAGQLPQSKATSATREATLSRKR